MPTIQQQTRMTKAEAGRLGGKSTFQKYGRSWMAQIGKLGAVSLHNKYYIAPIGTSNYALVSRVDNTIKATF